MKRLKIVLLILIGGYLVVSLLLYLFQERLIFLDTQLKADHIFKFDIPHQEINIDMPDGGKVNVLHFRRKDSKGLIVYFHGNAGNLARWGVIAVEISALGHDVAIMDYRGFGKSTGNRSNETMKSDALEVYNYFKAEYGEEKMILYGRSLGSGIAAYVASENSPAKIILETPYYNFTSVVDSKFPLFPTSLLLKYKFHTYEYLKAKNCPIYIFHGTNDSVVPF